MTRLLMVVVLLISLTAIVVKYLTQPIYPDGMGAVTIKITHPAVIEVTSRSEGLKPGTNFLPPGKYQLVVTAEKRIGQIHQVIVKEGETLNLTIDLSLDKQGQKERDRQLLISFGVLVVGIVFGLGWVFLKLDR